MAAEIISKRHRHAICFTIGRIPIYPGTQRKYLIIQQVILNPAGDGYRWNVDARLPWDDALTSGRRSLGWLRVRWFAASSPGWGWAYSPAFNLASAFL